MNEQFIKEWQIIQNAGFFSLFTSPTTDWEAIMELTFLLAESYPDTLLSALFQLSGIFLPLSLSINKKNGKQLSWLNKIGSGDAIAAHCMTEKMGGTDVFAMQTTAQKRGSKWIINGEKSYICNVGVANVGLLYTHTENYQSPYNISCFLLDMNTPGITISAPYKKIGLSSVPMNSFSLTDVCLTTDDLIASAQNGYHMVNMSTTFERLLIPIAFVGSLRKFYKLSSGEFKAEIYRQLTVCESLLKTTLFQVNLAKWHRHYIQLGCLLKWHLSESYIYTARLMNDELQYRDALSSWIYSGTNDVLKLTLGQIL